MTGQELLQRVLDGAFHDDEGIVYTSDAEKACNEVCAELTTLRAQVAGLEKDTIVLAHAVQSWTVSEGPHTKACQEGGDSRCSACIAFECRDAVTKEAKDAVQRAIDLEEAASAAKEPA